MEKRIKIKKAMFKKRKTEKYLDRGRHWFQKQKKPKERFKIRLQD